MRPRARAPVSDPEPVHAVPRRRPGAHAREIEVEVPAGIDDGQRLRLTGRGPAAPRGGIAGDLYVNVRVRPHPSLERHGYDLVHQRRIAMTQAALGTVLDVDTLDEPEEHHRPARHAAGSRVPAAGPGVPVLQGAVAATCSCSRRRRPQELSADESRSC